MNKIRILVADDEPLARRGVIQLLAPHADMDVVGQTRNGPETRRALESLVPDLLFLDIQMPEMDGFEVLLNSNQRPKPEVVFVTAHEQFAVRAFEAQALDYLVKPLHIQRFEATLQRIRERLQARRTSVEQLLVATPTGKLVIPIEEVNWIEADDYYSRLHTGPKTHLLRESLTSLEARLDARFVRVHRSAIIQLDRLRELRSTLCGDEAVLRDGSRIPVSRRKRSALDQILLRRIITLSGTRD